MATRMSIAGHPIHPMLVPLPIGLWIFSLVADLVFLSTGNEAWASAARLTLGGGIIGALLAAVPGLIDFTGLHDPQARRTAALHMGLNLAIVALMAWNFALRSPEDSGRGPMLVSLVGVLALVVSGWLGGHLVHVLGVTQPRSQASAASEPRSGSPHVPGRH